MENYAILIADAGGTKVDWALLRKDARPIRFKTKGLNAALASELEMKVFFLEAATHCQGIVPDEIKYFGAGCTTDIIPSMTKAIHEAWPDVNITIGSDLVGAAISLFGGDEGIACILGTGSNSGLYQRGYITHNIPPLGFILGDEGGGATLGKRLIQEIFKGEASPELKEDFFKEFSLSKEDIIRKVYREPAPNKFLASLVPFIRNHIDNPLMEKMVIEEFREFFRRNVAHYPDAHSLPLAFTGSVAFHFEPWLRQAASAEGFEINLITKSPLAGLVRYYL